jgi:hypothetical protein
LPNILASKFPNPYQDPPLNGHSNDVNQSMNYENTENANQFNSNYSNMHPGNDINHYNHITNHQNQYYNHSIPQNTYVDNTEHLDNHFTSLQTDNSTSLEYSEPNHTDNNYNRTDSESLSYDEHNTDNKLCVINENYNHDNEIRRNTHINNGNHGNKKVHNNSNNNDNNVYFYNTNEVKLYTQIFMYTSVYVYFPI